MMRIFTIEEIKELADSRITFSTGSSILDSLLSGGFKSFTLNEIYGEAGAGKTRLLHQIALCSVLKSIPVHYIDNEGSFRPEIIENIGRRYKANNLQLLRKIYIAKPSDKEEFLQLLRDLYYIDLKILIIDTLVTHFRMLEKKEFSRTLKEALRILRYLASKGTCVIFTNQMTQKDEEKRPVGDKIIKPIIDTRLRMEKEDARIRCRVEIGGSPNMKSELFRNLSIGLIGINERP